VEEETLEDDFGTTELTKRELAYISPRLRILNNLPFAIPFEDRVSIFRSIIRNDKIKLQGAPLDFGVPGGKKVTIRRNHVSQDGFDHLNDIGDSWKGRLAITFVDQWGQEVRYISVE
jgi:ubiquitin-protein ligase E3 C